MSGILTSLLIETYFSLLLHGKQNFFWCLVCFNIFSYFLHMQGVPNKTSFSGLWAVKPFRLAKMTKVRGVLHNFRKCNILTYETPPHFFEGFPYRLFRQIIRSFLILLNLYWNSTWKDWCVSQDKVRLWLWGWEMDTYSLPLQTVKLICNSDNISALTRPSLTRCLDLG